MTGKSNTQDASEEGKYTFFDRSSVIKKSDKYIYDGKYTIIPGEGIFEPKYANGKFDLHQRAYAISSDYYIPKYLFYLIKKNKNIFYKYSVGSTVPSLRASSFEWINNIKIVSLEVQKQIIDIIEPVENLFLKYSNCVRIDTFENTKKDLKALIDIIKPIENLISNMKKIKVNLWNLIKKIKIKKTKQVNIFSSIKTGNLNVNASLKNGKYPFFTCGKKILKTNSKSFKGRYILLSGNGELYSWWIDGEFDLYQRVYALKEKSNFFTTYYSLIKGIDKLRRRANGAVIKFIKINDIKSISLYESSHEKMLETFFIAINKCEEIESKAYKILDFIVQILIK